MGFFSIWKKNTNVAYVDILQTDEASLERKSNVYLQLGKDRFFMR